MIKLHSTGERSANMKRQNSNIISISFISDGAYSLPLGVALSSLKRHRDRDRLYSIGIVANKMDRELLDEYKGLECEGFKIKIIDAESFAEYTDFGRMADAAHVSESALYKFNLPEIFPDTDKLLYLDADIIVRDSLTSLYDTELGEDYAAVCKDIGAEVFPSHYNSRLGIAHSAYFNSGVMLLNLKKLRCDGIPERLLEYKRHGKNDYMDQDAFNVVFAERVRYIPFSYNTALSCWREFSADELCRYYGMEETSIERLFLDAKILHMSAAEKPWRYHNVIASEVWLSEFAASPFKKFELIRAASSVGLSKLNNGCDYGKLRYNSKLMSPKQRPAVSVITPVYNSQEHLPECIESLMCQTLENAEFIIVDDGSTDNSSEILAHYARLDERIRIYTQKNKYAGAARNKGIEHAKGRLLTFLDSDDIMLPSALAAFVTRANDTGADIVISSAYHFIDDPRDRRIAPWCLREGFIPSGRRISADTLGKYIFQISAGAPWGKIYKTDFINSHGIRFPSSPRAEDTYFVYRAFALAESIGVLKRQTVLYRNDPGSHSLENTKDIHPTACLSVKRELYESLLADGVWEKVKQSFINNLINTAAYHFRTFKTRRAFTELYNEFKYNAVPFYGIDIKDSAYFHVRGEYEYIKRILESEDPADYFYKEAMEYKRQADSHWRRLMSIESAGKDGGSVKNLDAVPDYEAFSFFTSEVYAIRSSVSYRLGRFLTYIPRKIRSFIRLSRRIGFTGAVIHALSFKKRQKGGAV